MKRSAVLITVIVILLVVILVLVLPRATTNQGTFKGVQVDSEGAELAECDITFKYTVKNDECTFLEFTAADYHSDSSDWTSPSGLIKHPDAAYEMISFMEYNAGTNSYSDIIHFIIGPDHGWYLISINASDPETAQFYFAADGSDVDAAEILAMIYPK